MTGFDPVPDYPDHPMGILLLGGLLFSCAFVGIFYGLKAGG